MHHSQWSSQVAERAQRYGTEVLQDDMPKDNCETRYSKNMSSRRTKSSACDSTKPESRRPLAVLQVAMGFGDVPVTKHTWSLVGTLVKQHAMAHIVSADTGGELRG